jgi:hypothetical protein
MTVGVNYSERVYRALLAFYPRRFRLRFGGELEQMFRDCSGQPMISLWLQAVEDLVVSVPREWKREIAREDCDIDFHGLVDAVIIAFVVGPLLLGWGWAGAVVALNLSDVSWDAWRNPVAMGLAAAVASLMGIVIGVLSAAFVARYGAIDRPRIKV